MKLVLCAAVLCIFQCYSVTGYVGGMQIEPIEGKCVAPNGDLFAPGEVYYKTENCEKLVCNDPKQSHGKFLIDIFGCAPVNLKADLAEKCHLVAGNGPYPDCCPHKLICDN